MEYNSRASQQFRSQAGGNGGRGRQQHQQNDSDAFMRLVNKDTMQAQAQRLMSLYSLIVR